MRRTYIQRLAGYSGLLLIAFATGMLLRAAQSRGQETPIGVELPVIRITAQKFRYEPEAITLQLGQRVILDFFSLDFVHGFSLPELGVRADLPPGQHVRIELTPAKEGTFGFHCDNFCGSGHEDMAGVVHVVGPGANDVAQAQPARAERAIGGHSHSSAPRDGLSVQIHTPSTVALARLQNSIFGPRCSACHNGTGVTLPTSMDLSSATATASALIGIASAQQPESLRVRPGDPDKSLLLQKLVGAAGIPGGRMPLGGPYLGAEEIAAIRSWIAAGPELYAPQ